MLNETHVIWSPQLRVRRAVDVYLPASYGDSRRTYPVVYFQDGQNLSDPAMAFAGTWELDRALAHLAGAGLEMIAVGIHNGGARRVQEYSPFDDAQHGPGAGDRYLRFVVHTVKTRIDARYRTRPGRAATTIVGSSMGGLIALHAFLAASDTFGAVGALSPSLWFAGRAMLDEAVRRRTPRGRVYLDAGTGEGADVVRDVRALARILRDKGYRARGPHVADLPPPRMLRVVEAPGHQHREPDWAQRLPEALAFLLSRW